MPSLKMLLEKTYAAADFLNPLLVREVRQSMRSNAFVGSIVSTSALCMIVVIIGAASAGSARYHEQRPIGAGVFGFTFSIIWLITCIIFPLVAACRFRNERVSGEFELLSITRISCMQILVGKLQSAAIQSILILIVSAPFLMICYLLRGISAVNIITCILFAVVACLVFSQIGILIGSLRISAPVFAFAVIAFIAGLLMLTVPMLEMLLDGYRYSDPVDSLVEVFLSSILVGGYVFLIALFCASCIMELPVKNRSLPIRSLILMVSAFAPLGMGLAREWFNDADFFFFLTLLPAVVAALFMPSSSDLTPLPARQIWKKPFVRLVKPFLYQGKESFAIWYTLIVACVAVNEYFFFFKDINMMPVTLTCTSVFACCWLGNVFCQIFHIKATPILVSIISCGIPSFGAIILGAMDSYETALLLCPFTFSAGIENSVSDKTVLLPFVVAFWVFVLFIGIRSFIIKIAKEKRHEEKTLTFYHNIGIELEKA